MSKSEYIAPAVQRLLDLCTNGLFVNLRDFPEPMKNTYQHLREAVRGGQLVGAELALTDMIGLCLQFPVLMACSILTRSQATDSEKQEVYGRLTAHAVDAAYCMDTLIPALREFFLHNPDENAALFLTAAEDMSRRIKQQDLLAWCHRVQSGAYLELNRPEAASELITHIDLLNQHLRQVLHFYTHVKEKPEAETLTFDCLGTEIIAEPWVFRGQGQTFLMEKMDAPSCKMFCRGQNDRSLVLFDAPKECALFHEEVLPEPGRSLLEELSGVYTHAEYVRPQYWDRWLRQALGERDRGYLLLEAESNMGKSMYTCMLDPASPFYTHAQFLENMRVCRYAISLYPDTQRPSYFVRALNAMFPEASPILFTEEAVDLRRRIVEFLNARVEECPERPLLLILDGMHQLDYSQDLAFSLPKVLPAASQLTAGVYILLTDRCAASDAATVASHRNWLLDKDPLARIGSFTKNHPQHQQLFRTYLSQYVLHANSEDNPVVAALSGYMEADLCLAHTLRDILVIGRPEAYMSLTDFFRQYKSPAKLLQLYLDDLMESYGPFYAPYIREILQLLALAPHPLSDQDVEYFALRRPAPHILWAILRDLKPFLTLYDARTIGFSTTKTHLFVLAMYGQEWKNYCVQLLQERAKRLAASPYPLTREHLLTDLDYYARGAGWKGHEALLTALEQALMPPGNREEALPLSVVDYFRTLSDFFSDETENPFRMDTLWVLALSPLQSDRRIACGRWDSLEGTPAFRPELYAKSCRLYMDLLSKQDPLCTSTIEAMAAFRRKSESLYDYAFVWHTEKLTRTRLAEALAGSLAYTQNADPCNLPWVKEKLPELVYQAEADLQNPLPQECAVLTHLLMPFCEAFLRALLPMLCSRELLAEAAEWFAFIRQLLIRIYQCRQKLCYGIRQYATLLLTDADCKEPLYNCDFAARSLEESRLRLLESDLRLWLETFPEKSRLQYFREKTSIWRTEEAILRLESIHKPSPKEYSVNPRTIRNQIAQLSGEPALRLADQWYDYLRASLAAIRGSIPIGRSNDLCAVQLVRAEILCELGRLEELHACVTQLRFFLSCGALSSKRTLEVVCALGTKLLAADTLAHYPSAEALVALYASLHSRLQKSRSFLTSRQIAQVQTQIKESFPECMRSQQFYAYLLPAQARILGGAQGAEECGRRAENAKDPVEKITAYLAQIHCAQDKETPRQKLLEYLQQWIEKDILVIPPALLDYGVSLALELLGQRPKAAFAAPFYQLWVQHMPPEIALLGLDGRMNGQSRPLYRRVASCFWTEGAEVQPEVLRDQIQAQESNPVYQAFDLLCVAIAAGSVSLASAGTLAQMGYEILEADGPITVSRISLALELVKLQILALCMDGDACLTPLQELCSRWIDLIWQRAIAKENQLEDPSYICRTQDGHFHSVPPVPLQMDQRILEDCIGSDAVVSTPLLGPAFRVYARLWKTLLCCPLPESLPEYLQQRLLENWNQL